MTDHTVWTLANMAGCAVPDDGHSAGAEFLRHVAADYAERRDYARGCANDPTLLPDDDELHEIADGAPDPFTHRRWQEFVDLGAYREDITEYGDVSEDMTQNAAVALYMIAERLCYALRDEDEEALEDTQD